MERAGADGFDTALEAPLLALEAEHGVASLQAPAGGILRITLAPQPYSSTGIRALLADPATAHENNGQLQAMLPAAVLSYICQHRLYRE